MIRRNYLAEKGYIQTKEIWIEVDFRSKECYCYFKTREIAPLAKFSAAIVSIC